MEIDIDDVLWEDDVFTRPPAVKNGELSLPTGPAPARALTSARYSGPSAAEMGRYTAGRRCGRAREGAGCVPGSVRKTGGDNDERQCPGLQFSAGRQGRGFHPVRGGHDLDRGAGVVRRRGGQDREPGAGRSRPPAAPRQARRRPVVLPPVQRQQEVDNVEPEIAEGARDRQGDDEEGRHHGREHGAGDDRAPRPRLRVGQEDQPSHHLLPGQGLRNRQPAREGARLRHDRAGRGRPDQRHRRARPAAGQAGPELWRHRHRHADGGDDPRRACTSATAPARDAGCRWRCRTR